MAGAGGPAPDTRRVDEPTLRRKIQLRLTVAALVITAGAGWLFLVQTESAMRTMDSAGPFGSLMMMMMRPGAALPYLAATLVMWVVMMIAMMVPAVIPMLIVFRKLNRGPSSGIDPLLFALGYLGAWSGFSVVAVLVQWGIHGAGWLGGDLLALRPTAAAVILILAGLYQLSPAKDTCLDKCRTPMGFFLANWRDGPGGAFLMGLHHGLFCIGCCWMLMLIMFVGGAMSVMTMALLSVLILAERVLPAGPWVARLPGFGLIAWGILLGIAG